MGAQVFNFAAKFPQISPKFCILDYFLPQAGNFRTIFRQPKIYGGGGTIAPSPLPRRHWLHILVINYNNYCILAAHVVSRRVWSRLSRPAAV